MGAAVTDGARVVDVGTDHGTLPLLLAQAGVTGEAIGVDRSAAALHTARESVAWRSAPPNAALVEGDGLAVVEGRIDVVTFAGVGGDTIAEVVARDEALARGVTRLVLQPNRDERALRRALGGLGWRIVAERLVAQDGRMFLVIVAEPGSDGCRDDIDIIVGPCLRHGDPLLGAWLQVQRAWVRDQLAGRERAGDADGAEASRRHLAALDAADSAIA